MVFISFPTSSTSEEDALVRKYMKLSKKRKSLQETTKPEPKVKDTVNDQPVQAKDAKKLIEKLKSTGRLPLIPESERKSEFKRKVQSKPAKTRGHDDETQAQREMVSYEDDLFS